MSTKKHCAGPRTLHGVEARAHFLAQAQCANLNANPNSSPFPSLRPKTNPKTKASLGDFFSTPEVQPIFCIRLPSKALDNLLYNTKIVGSWEVMLRRRCFQIH